MNSLFGEDRWVLLQVKILKIVGLIYASRRKRQIKACIFDSPFSSLKKLIR
jgi:hypothetical protein